MAWSASKIFSAHLKDALDRTAVFDLDTDTLKVALFDNDITPDNTVTAANSAYGAGQWVSAGNEVSDAAEWTVAGMALASKAVTFTTTTVKFDAADTASGASATLAAVFGGFIYDDTLTTPVADQGVCYNYFGGTNSVIVVGPKGVVRS